MFRSLFQSKKEPDEPLLEICNQKLKYEWHWTPEFDINDVLYQNVPAFEMKNEGGHSSIWRFYLKWKSNESGEASLSVFLQGSPSMPGPEGRRKVTILPLEAQFGVRIKHPTDPRRDLYKRSTPHDFICQESWGIPALITKEKLKEFVKEEKVTFIFEVWLVIEPRTSEDAENARKLKIQELRDESYWKCEEGMKNAFMNWSYADVVIVTSDGIEFPAYRNLLEARSKYFEKIFQEIRENRGRYQSDRIDGDSKLPIEVNLRSDVMKILLCHIFFGHLNPELIDPEVVAFETAKELVVAAKEHGLLFLVKYLLCYYPGLDEQFKSKLPETATLTDIEHWTPEEECGNLNQMESNGNGGESTAALAESGNSENGSEK